MASTNLGFAGAGPMFARFGDAGSIPAEPFKFISKFRLVSKYKMDVPRVLQIQLIDYLVFIEIYPIPSSSDDSSGVPHWRQRIAPQSPQVRGSLTSTAQRGQ